MIRLRLSFLLLLLISGSCSNENNSGTSNSPFKKLKIIPPESFRDTNRVDIYHGFKIPDPYHWLEDLDSPSSARWTKDQGSLTNKYFGEIGFRKAIQTRLTELWDFERISAPFQIGSDFYLFRNTGLQNQDVLYRINPNDGKLKMVLDPNTFSTDGTAALQKISFSQDGSIMAFQVAENGSAWSTIYLLNVETGRMLADQIEYAKFSNISWYGDGFYYSRFPAPQKDNQIEEQNAFHQVFYHKVGDNQSDDELIFADRASPFRKVLASTTPDERFLLLSVHESTGGNALFFQDLKANPFDFVPVVESFDDHFKVVGNIGNDLLLLTDNNAARNRLIRVQTSRKDPKYWKEILAESEDILQKVLLIDSRLIALYQHDNYSKLKVYNLKGDFEGEVKLPDIGTITDIQGAAKSRSVFFTFSTYTQLPTVYELDLKNLETKVYRKTESPFISNNYETRQVAFKSTDGQRVPMTLLFRKGLKLDGQRPTILIGSMGFEQMLTPRFNPTGLNLLQVLLENGGVGAIVNVRGGTEFGSIWHEAGLKDKKQAAINDYQAAAEYLFTNNYTDPTHLAAYGHGNGGLLVGASLVQRPELFGAAVPSAGLMDMLRYQNFSSGWIWKDEFGLSSNQTDFEYLFAYSPLHNVVPEKYPATMMTVSNKDDLVIPAHSYKFAAELQANQKGEAPVLIRIDSNTGHGAGKPITKVIEEGTDVLTFIFYNLRYSIVYTN